MAMGVSRRHYTDRESGERRRHHLHESVLQRAVKDAARAAGVATPATTRCGYTIGMKTAVSLPDRVFREAEGHAKRTRKSRSQLYADALAEYLARHAPDEVTEAMNVVVDELGSAATDIFVQQAGRRVLKSVEW